MERAEVEALLNSYIHRPGINRIGLFGLSGNPPTGHNGHAGLVWYLSHCGAFDVVFVLPVYDHPFSSKKSILEPFGMRCRMCALAFESEGCDDCPVHVLPLEKYVFLDMTDPLPNVARCGTIDVVRWILNQHAARDPSSSSLELSLVLGTDTYRDLLMGKWKSSEESVSCSMTYFLSLFLYDNCCIVFFCVFVGC